MEILVGTDGSRSAESAVSWAVGAAGAIGAELVLVCVSPPGSDLGETERLLLGDWSRTALEAAVPFRTEVVVGDPRLQLLEFAATAEAALVVVGAGHERWFPALHLGSTSHYLAHHLDRPIAVVPYGHASFDAANVVLGVDGSPGSAAASRWALWMASAVGGDITAVYAWQRSAARMHNVDKGVDSAAEADLACRAWTEELRAAGVLAGFRAIEAEPVDALINAVTDVGARMVVLGTRGSGGFMDLQLGSVPLRSLQAARAPIVLVPPAG